MRPTLTTPVLLVIFNRPDKVRSLVKALAAVRPERIFVAADGPRPNVPEDAVKCAEAREAIKEISWPCEVRTNFSDANLSVDPAVEKAINWFFENTDRGIILEDDCIPHPDFFRFAEAMLEKYKDDARIMNISGDNFQNGIRRGNGSYYFSHYPNTWGWATWRRAWKLYDTKLANLPTFVAEEKISKIRPQRDEQEHWLGYFKKLRNGTHTPWDGKWVFALWNNNGISLTPNVNLVENIGFGSDSTHTKDAASSMRTGAYSMEKDIIHPSTIETNETADRYLFDRVFRVNLWRRIKYFFHK